MLKLIEERYIENWIIIKRSICGRVLIFRICSEQQKNKNKEKKAQI